MRFLESVRGGDAYVMQAHGTPVNEMIMEQLIMIDALKRASASRINAVIPYFAYARQDKKLHTGQIQGFFNVPLDHLTALPVLAGHVRGKGWSDMVVVAPDPGRGKMAQKYAAHLESDIAFMQKGRRPDVRNASETLGLIGDVRGRRCVVVDNIIDTGGTIANAAAGLQRAGATEIVAVAPLIAASIRAVFADQSASEILHGENLESLPEASPRHV